MGIKSIQWGCPFMLSSARLIKISLFKKIFYFSIFLQILDIQHGWGVPYERSFCSLSVSLTFFLFSFPLPFPTFIIKSDRIRTKISTVPSQFYYFFTSLKLVLTFCNFTCAKAYNHLIT